jgi:hypothetical protein
MIEATSKFIRLIADLNRKIQRLNKLDLILTVVQEEPTLPRIGIDQEQGIMLDQA